MAGDLTNKIKIVYIIKILLENTDDLHAITMQEILAELERYGISAERKSVYNDIDQLIAYGMDIDKRREKRTFFYKVCSRDFELAELKLLVDSVQSARFITEKKSNILIKKIEGLASKYEASQLQRQVFVTERVKTENEQILINIDALHSAISCNSKIKFQYFNRNEKKQIQLRHDGAFYEVSPWALTLTDENYYLIAYDPKADLIKYFRVDKMLNISLTDEAREGQQKFASFDIATYSQKRFRMYDGEEKRVKLLCSNGIAGVIIDRFGMDVMLHPYDAEHFTVNVDVAVSDQFFGWVIAMSDSMKIIGPDEVTERMALLVEKLAKQYGKE